MGSCWGESRFLTRVGGGLGGVERVHFSEKKKMADPGDGRKMSIQTTKKGIPEDTRLYDYNSLIKRRTARRGAEYKHLP